MNDTREEIKESRKQILKNASRVTKIKKGDKRVKTSTRLCSVCCKNLIGYSYSTGETKAKENYFYCYYSDLLTLNICQDIRSCYQKLENKGDKK